jgi:Zn-dependent peptidase ImmA (M78 family)/predicted secreted protein
MVSMQARRHALQEADTLLRELDVAQDAPIDVFALIARLDLELVFNNLKTILGAFLPHGAGGIMLSTQRGAAVQRYTAAHEIGHWVLDHEAAFDTEADLYTPSHDREQLAQIFASQLLMPPPLVYATAARCGVTNSETATGPLVYHIARDMGASYEAVVRQLGNLGLITRYKRDELLAIQPATIKTQLSLGHRPVGQVDVWPVDVGFSGGAITVTEGDEIVIVLPENRSTGYQWLTEADLRERAERRVQPPPLIDPETVIRNLDLDWVPRAGARTPPSKQDIDRALSNIPGNASPTRILLAHVADAETPNESGHELPGDEEILTGPELHAVEDTYYPSWTTVRPSERRALRRSIARGEALFAAVGTTIERATGAIEAVAPSAGELLVGGTGARVIALRTAGEGRDTYRLVYSSAYDPSAAPAETYQIDVAVVPSPAVAQRKRHLQLALETGLDSLDEVQGLDQGSPGVSRGD